MLVGIFTGDDNSDEDDDEQPPNDLEEQNGVDAELEKAATRVDAEIEQEVANTQIDSDHGDDDIDSTEEVTLPPLDAESLTSLKEYKHPTHL